MTDKPGDTPTPRPSARLIVLDEHGAALLFQFTFPDRTFWGTPGGALEHDVFPDNFADLVAKFSN